MQKLLLLVLIFCSGMTFISHANMDAKLSRGTLVTAKGDTLSGELVDFQSHIRTHKSVVFKQADDKEIVFDAQSLRRVHTEGHVYTSVKDQAGYLLTADVR